MNEQQIKTVAILSPGDMGHAIGRELQTQGFDVIACLKDRSVRTKGLSQKAGIREVDGLADLVIQADVILSILVPAQAEDAAKEIAGVIQQAPSLVHFVDCNAIAPQTVQRIGGVIESAGGLFSDASIIGFPPGTSETPRLYVSGPRSSMLTSLDGKGIAVKQIGPEIGQASGIKMCYAGMTKGTMALYYALTCVAEKLGLLDSLLSEIEFSQPAAHRRMSKFLPKLPAKAWRWAGEMEEIAATFESVGVTPNFHLGAAQMYELISQTSFGKETPETIDLERTLEATVAGIVRQTSTASRGESKGRE